MFFGVKCYLGCIREVQRDIMGHGSEVFELAGMFFGGSILHDVLVFQLRGEGVGEVATSTLYLLYASLYILPSLIERGSGICTQSNTIQNYVT